MLQQKRSDWIDHVPSNSKRERVAEVDLVRNLFALRAESVDDGRFARAATVYSIALMRTSPGFWALL
jgi:hypothetical protein